MGLWFWCVWQGGYAGDSRPPVLADAHHMELFTPHTLLPIGHTHTQGQTHFSLCLWPLCVLMLSYSKHPTTFSFFCFSSCFSASLFSLSVLVSVCLCSPLGPLCLSSVIHCFQKMKLCLTGSRWQAGLCVCVHVITVIRAVCQRTGESTHTHTHTHTGGTSACCYRPLSLPSVCFQLFVVIVSSSFAFSFSTVHYKCVFFYLWGVLWSTNEQSVS